MERRALPAEMGRGLEGWLCLGPRSRFPSSPTGSLIVPLTTDTSVVDRTGKESGVLSGNRLWNTALPKNPALHETTNVTA